MLATSSDLSLTDGTRCGTERLPLFAGHARKRAEEILQVINKLQSLQPHTTFYILTIHVPMESHDFDWTWLAKRPQLRDGYQNQQASLSYWKLDVALVDGLFAVQLWIWDCLLFE